MEREIKRERISKVSVSKFKDYFSEESVCYDDFMMSPVVRLKSMTESSFEVSNMTVGVICNGTAKVVINNRQFELHPNSLFLIREGAKITSFRCTKACMGYFVTCSTEFVESIKLDTSDMLSTAVLFSTKPCFEANRSEVASLSDICDTARMVASRGALLYDKKILASLLTSFYYVVASIINNSMADDANRADGSRADELMRQFIAELSASCERERSVEYYAKQLGITPKYLSLICKKKVGANASKVIDGAVVNKAKELLTHSGMSIQEVSERLNFVSQSFFGKYFKQRTGVSPSRYKVQN